MKLNPDEVRILRRLRFGIEIAEVRLVVGGARVRAFFGYQPGTGTVTRLDVRAGKGRDRSRLRVIYTPQRPGGTRVDMVGPLLTTAGDSEVLVGDTPLLPLLYRALAAERGDADAMYARLRGPRKEPGAGRKTDTRLPMPGDYAAVSAT